MRLGPIGMFTGPVIIVFVFSALRESPIPASWFRMLVSSLRICSLQVWDDYLCVVRVLDVDGIGLYWFDSGESQVEYGRAYNRALRYAWCDAACPVDLSFKVCELLSISKQIKSPSDYEGYISAAIRTSIIMLKGFLSKAPEISSQSLRMRFSLRHEVKSPAKCWKETCGRQSEVPLRCDPYLPASWICCWEIRCVWDEHGLVNSCLAENDVCGRHWLMLGIEK